MNIKYILKVSVHNTIVSGHHSSSSLNLQAERVRRYTNVTTVGLFVGTAFGVNVPSWFGGSSSVTGNVTKASSTDKPDQTVSDLYLWMQQQQKQQHRHSFNTPSATSAEIITDNTSSMTSSASYLTGGVVQVGIQCEW